MSFRKDCNHRVGLRGQGDRPWRVPPLGPQALGLSEVRHGGPRYGASLLPMAPSLGLRSSRGSRCWAGRVQAHHGPTRTADPGLVWPHRPVGPACDDPAKPALPLRLGLSKAPSSCWLPHDVPGPCLLPRAHADTHTHTHADVHTQTRACTDIHTHTHAHIHTCTQT